METEADAPATVLLLLLFSWPTEECAGSGRKAAGPTGCPCLGGVVLCVVQCSSSLGDELSESSGTVVMSTLCHPLMLGVKRLEIWFGSVPSLLGVF